MGWWDRPRATINIYIHTYLHTYIHHPPSPPPQLPSHPLHLCPDHSRAFSLSFLKSPTLATYEANERSGERVAGEMFVVHNHKQN